MITEKYRSKSLVYLLAIRFEILTNLAETEKLFCQLFLYRSAGAARTESKHLTLSKTEFKSS